MNLEDLIRLQESERIKRKPKKIIYPHEVNTKLTNLWNTNSEDEWNFALERYWKLVKPVNLNLERKMEKLNQDEIRNSTATDFYVFLYYEYFVWKFTQKNWLEANRKHLEKYLKENRLNDLDRIKKDLFTFDLDDIRMGLKIATSINGLGVAGGSGLLALIFPDDFGTVDKVVVNNLKSIKDIKQKDTILSINPDEIKLNDGVELIKIMRDRSNELNINNNTNKWTPRKVDQVLWGFRN